MAFNIAFQHFTKYSLDKTVFDFILIKTNFTTFTGIMV